MTQRNSAELLDEVAAFIRHYVVLMPSQLYCAALWVAHTHCFEAADTTPYLSVTSAEKQCGKSRLLEVLSLLVRKPWFTSRVSSAVLIRKVDKEQPTLLLDESDTAFNGPVEYGETLRGILNSGHRRGGCASLCIGQGANIDYKDFQTYCPKVIAGIGQLPDTVADRSIPIRLQRRTPSETVERFRHREASVVASSVRRELDAWGKSSLAILRDARPKPPEGLRDRQEEGVEPLLAIADLAGGEWPQRCRTALQDLLTGTAAQDDSIRVRLLKDIQTIFRERDGVVSSVQLTGFLCEMEESSWAEQNHGKPLTPVGLARLLKPFNVVPKDIRIGGKVLKGYAKEYFLDAWSRYLRPEGVVLLAASDGEPQQPLQSSIYAAETQISEALHPELVAASKSEKSPISMPLVAPVAGQTPHLRQNALIFEGEL